MYLKLFNLTLLFIFVSNSAYAYIGPGLGLGALAIMILIVVFFLLGIFFLVYFSVRIFIKKKSKKFNEIGKENDQLDDSGK